MTYGRTDRQTWVGARDACASKNIWHKIWLILHHPKKFEHNWIKNGPAVRFYFWALFANLNILNFIACAIVQCVNAFKDQNKHSEEDTKFISDFWDLQGRGSSFLEYETFESITLCHLQELEW